jgi:subtilase family serine protease
MGKGEVMLTGLRRFRALAVGLACSASWFGPSAVGISVVNFSVAPHPLIARHIVLPNHQNQPPTTAECRALGFSCYQPAQLQKAYNLAPLYADGFNGAGRTIVIVDSFGSPTIKADLKAFDQAFNLPDPPSLDIITPAGPVTFDNTNPDMLGWAGETTLDVEWSHSMAPGAKILLVETPVSETEGVQGFPEMMKAENYVINHGLGDVISQSFGATEETFPNAQAILNLRSAFKNARAHNVTVLASSGDFGATNAKLDLTCCYTHPTIIWPSSDPLVTSLGGTQLHLDDAGNRIAPDNVWNDGFAAAGGGPSLVFSRPAFQQSVRSVVGTRRGIPDISMSSACDGGVDTYLTFFADPNANGWYIFCGTSEASPLFSGIVAIADQVAGHRLGYLNDRLYKLLDQHPNGIVDVTAGNNTFTFCQSSCGTPAAVNVTVQGFTAAPGYDMASGLGTLNANKLVRALAENDSGGGNQG